jgi:hypothetical protein
MSPLLARLRHSKIADGLPLSVEERRAADIAAMTDFDLNRSFGSIHATCLWESLTTRWKRGIIPPLHE